MLIEASSIPKFRDLSQPGDDVIALVPQRLIAVFDGATDTVGTLVDGQTPGRFAASAAAGAMVQVTTGAQRGRLGPEELLAAMNQAIARGLAQAGAGRVRAGTTAAVVEDLGDTLRFLIVGDSGIRLNGSETFRFHKDVDVLYTAGRVAVFRRLQARGLNGDALEAATRQLVFRGLGQAGQSLLDADDIAQVLAQTRAACSGRLQPDALVLVEEMMQSGIAGGQYRFGNLAGHSLGYGVLDGTETRGPDVACFTRPRASVRSIELFTDGYLTCPAGTRLQDWEAEFARVEALDPAKSGAFPGVKGSTSAFFSDDRTVVAAHCIAPDSSTR